MIQPWLLLFVYLWLFRQPWLRLCQKSAILVRLRLLNTLITLFKKKYHWKLLRLRLFKNVGYFAVAVVAVCSVSALFRVIDINVGCPSWDGMSPIRPNITWVPHLTRFNTLPNISWVPHLTRFNTLPNISWVPYLTRFNTLWVMSNC